MRAESDLGCTPFSLYYSEGFDNDEIGYIMLKEFSKLSFGNIALNYKDIELIKKKPEAWGDFLKFKKELEQMKNSKFYASYSYYNVLQISKLNFKKLATLTKNKEFVSKFEANLHRFPSFKSDLRSNFKEAFEVRDRSETVNYRLNEIFKDFLPDIIIRKLVDNLSLEDLPQ